MQARLDRLSIRESIAEIRTQIDRCEAAGVAFLCCPEAALGGLADYVVDPFRIAIDVERGELHDALAPLVSDTVTTIVGFTELDGVGRLFNSAAVLSRGEIIGVYRKVHPAIRRSVYSAGTDAPVFTVDGLTFGVIICLDSTFAEPASTMAKQGATVLFIPSHNGLPAGKGGPELVGEARRCDIALATKHRITVVRADVTGHDGRLTSYGSSAIVGPDGVVIATAKQLEPDLLVAEIPVLSAWTSAVA